MWTVVDNGEGKNATGPDGISVVGATPPSVYNLQLDFGTFFPMVNGNI